jgi:hypothetical protein
MVYDTKTVLERYKQIQDLPEGEADESTCPLAGGSRPLQTAGCEPGGCQTCCLGVVEIVRRYNEQVEATSVVIEDPRAAVARGPRE